MQNGKGLDLIYHAKWERLTKFEVVHKNPMPISKKTKTAFRAYQLFFIGLELRRRGYGFAFITCVRQKDNIYCYTASNRTSAPPLGTGTTLLIQSIQPATNMGKKSRRPNRVAAFAKGVLDESLTAFNQLSADGNWEGMLGLEPQLSGFANGWEIEGKHMAAGAIYHSLATAHKSLGKPGGIEQAVVYFTKSIDMASKARDRGLQVGSVYGLAECY